MSEEFEGNIPNIEITSETGRIFNYKCVKTGQNLRYSCSSMRMIEYHDLTQCYECLGYNRSFARFYNRNACCYDCGMRLDFGYFIFVFLLEKARLLPKKFRMFCCVHHINDKKKEDPEEIVFRELIGEVNNGEEG